MKKRDILKTFLKLTILLSVCFLFYKEPVFASTSGICGDDVVFDISDGVLTISGNGAMYDYSTQICRGLIKNLKLPV